MSVSASPPPRSVPHLLTKVSLPSEKVSIIWDVDGSIVALVDGIGRVKINGLPTTLQSEDVKKALKVIKNGIFRFNSWQLTFCPKALGGGTTQSTQASEHRTPLLNKGKGKVADIYQENRPADPVIAAEYSNCPQKNTLFVGREALLNDLKGRLAIRSDQSINQVAVSGLGGVGKSSLVLEYLYRSDQSHSVVWWIQGEQPLVGYRNLGEALGIVKSTDRGDRVVEIVKEWLETNTNWVLVFDNVEDYQVVQSYLPLTSRVGQVIMTSRNPHTKNCLQVELFSPKESEDLLEKITGQTDRDKAQELAEELGRLPLALAQAGAYMRETQTSFSHYLVLFREVRQKLWKDEKKAQDYPETIGTTWKISINKIEEDRPEAVELLCRASYLAPDNIPRLLLSDSAQEPLLLSQNLHLLQSYSLITVGQEQDSYSIHRLVQASTRDNIASSETNRILRALLAVLENEWEFNNQDPNTWKQAKTLFSHLDSICNHIEKDETIAPLIGNFLNHLAVYCNSFEVKPLLAIDYHNRALAIARRRYGEEHEDVFGNLNNIGNVLDAMGDHSAAINYHMQALEITKKIREENHIDFAASYNNLGCVFEAKGEFLKAIEYHSLALKIREQHHGRNHPVVASSLSNLSSSYEGQGDYKKALEYQKEAYNIRKQTLSHDHFDIAESLYSLSTIVAVQGNNVFEAIKYQREALAIDKKVFGESHTRLSTGTMGLGVLLAVAGEYDQAIDCYNDALLKLKAAYGNKHPTVASCLNSLGNAYFQNGDHSKAIELHTEALAMKKSLLGEKHPEVATSLFDLATDYFDLGDLKRAMELYNQALTIRRETFGEKSLEVSITLNDLGNVFNAQKDYAKAIDHYQRALAIRKELLGEFHSTYADSLNCIGSFLEAQGKYEEALDYLVKALTIRRRTFGENHPGVASSLCNIGAVYTAVGDHDEAINYYYPALTIELEVFGDDHPSVAKTLSNLGLSYFMRGDQGDTQLALECFQQAFDIRKDCYGENHPLTKEIKRSLRLVSFTNSCETCAIL